MYLFELCFLIFSSRSLLGIIAMGYLDGSSMRHGITALVRMESGKC